jgi:cytoskeletal protein RodZ
MTDEPRDDLDITLARGLTSIAPSIGDTDATLESIRPRFRRARARRRARLAGSLAAVVAAAVVGTAALTQHPDHDRVRVQGHGTTTSQTSGTARPAPTTTRPSTSTTSASHASTPTTHAHPTPALGTAPATTPNTVPRAPQASTPSPTTTTPAPRTKTYATTGGSVTVRIQGTSVTLVSSSPSAGFTQDVRSAGPDEVEVRFSNGQHESRVRVRFENGQLQEDIQN